MVGVALRMEAIYSWIRPCHSVQYCNSRFRIKGDTKRKRKLAHKRIKCNFVFSISLVLFACSNSK